MAQDGIPDLEFGDQTEELIARLVADPEFAKGLTLFMGPEFIHELFEVKESK